MAFELLTPHFAQVECQPPGSSTDHQGQESTTNIGDRLLRSVRSSGIPLESRVSYARFLNIQLARNEQLAFERSAAIAERV
jgi:hypothetical protein